MESGEPPPSENRALEVARYFTQLGFTAFGGPAAHIAMMERQLVEQRRWLDRRHFLDLVAAVNFLPGPNSTQLALSLGLLRAGPMGLVLAGVCFILPAVLIILPIAYLYVHCGQTPHATAVMRGVGAAVIGVIASATWRLAKTSLTDRFSLVIAIIAAIAAVIGHQEHWGATDLMILAAAAFAGILRASRPARAMLPMFAPLSAAVFASPMGLGLMGLLFLKIGATLYGSGYLLLPYLRENFVIAHPWLSEKQLLDAVAVGQITPGPLLTTATFVGYLIGYRNASGLGGALLATAAIFAPSFFFVAILGRILPWLRAQPAARAALGAMNAAVVSLIAVTLINLAISALSPPGAWLPAAIAAGTVVVLVKWNINATWPILASAAIGWCAGQLGWV